jgi:hypothetical protein
MRSRAASGSSGTGWTSESMGVEYRKRRTTATRIAMLSILVIRIGIKNRAPNLNSWPCDIKAYMDGNVMLSQTRYAGATSLMFLNAFQLDPRK